MSSLKAHQLAALREISARPGVPASTIDGRTLRPLARLALVVDDAGMLRATDAGRVAARQPDPSPSRPHREPARQADRSPGKPREQPVPEALSDSQEKVLRYLVRQTGPIPVDHVDGRVLRALGSRGLVVESEGWVRPAANAEAVLMDHTRKGRERSVRRAASSARAARAESILRAAQDLEFALPRGSEIMIGPNPAYGDDVIEGFRAFARTME